MKNKKKQSIKHFIEKYFLVKSKDDINFASKRIMEADHIAYLIFLTIIWICQILMIIIKVTQGGLFESTKDIIHSVSYISLTVISLVAVLLLILFHKKKMQYQYFVVCSFVMIAIMFWGAAISLGSSLNGHSDLTVFSFSVIGISFLVSITPWIATMNISIITGLMILSMTILPEATDSISLGFYINIISICLLSIAGNIFNFYRRLKAIELEKKIIEVNKELQNQTIIDDLTKQYNRRFLTKLIDSKLNIGEKASGVMLIDIDHFKNINDTYGHLVGDTCLSNLGLIISTFVKDKDAYCVRYGGEEFLIYIDLVTKEELITYAEDLRNKIRHFNMSLDNDDLKVSIGLALAEEGITYTTLINRADTALYTAKETRDCVVFYEE